ncbi:hypothetical protein JHK85_046113 [Glycine max]|nr:hypothetical protein JHK86_045535 [Glycine max]KAG4952246.1 hypothetical protein JHK85_046113 [Glycine max]
MEETLLLPKENKRVSSNSMSSSSCSGFVQEFKKVSLMAAPMVVVSVSQFLLQMGMAGALETQCGQSFGTEQFHKLGNYVFCAILFLILSSAPISILWIFMDKLLVLLGQDHAISLVAGNYCIWLIPTLFGYSRFVFELGLGQNEAALSIGISYWLSVMLLIVYTVLSVMSEN